ncbi:MAG TPA: hypothetical protein VGV12_05465 [Gemmatimonadales bacterium]|nr:hypothetical protein [Gemmatimonadales bacterium]
MPPQSWRPLGLAFLYTGGAVVGTLGLESSSLGSGSKRELAVVGGAASITGFVMTLRKRVSADQSQDRSGRHGRGRRFDPGDGRARGAGVRILGSPQNTQNTQDVQNVQSAEDGTRCAY